MESLQPTPKKRKPSLSLLRDGRKIKLVYFTIITTLLVNGFTFWFFNPSSENLNESVKLLLIESTMYMIIATVIAYITGNVIQHYRYKPNTNDNGNYSEHSQ
jgi:heme/copper-type cytochrome/quinol oxidase subunit 2